MFAHLENHHHHWCAAYSIHIYTYHKRCFYYTFQTWKYSEFYSTTNFLAHRSAIFILFFSFSFSSYFIRFSFFCIFCSWLSIHVCHQMSYTSIIFLWDVKFSNKKKNKSTKIREIGKGNCKMLGSFCCRQQQQW